MLKCLRTCLACCLVPCAAAPGQTSQPSADAKAPADSIELAEVQIRGSRDASLQPALFYMPAEAAADRPGPATALAVGLHTWSGQYKDIRRATRYARQCRARGWVLIHPHFRGPNLRPEACASDLAVQDVLDAVAYARGRARIDPRRIYVVGVSGGGHMTMMMAAKAPKLGAAASAWVGISDLSAWHAQTRKAGLAYFRHVEKVCGGPPGASPRVDAEYRRRSPLTFLHLAKGLAVDLNAGIRDGHGGSVPVSHSLEAFNVLAQANGRPAQALTPREIRAMTRKAAVPAELLYHGPAEPKRRDKVLFRRSAGPARVTLFNGGHEIDVQAAFDWLAKQVKPAPPTSRPKPTAKRTTDQ